MKTENKAKSLANRLNGREYRNEITSEEAREARESGLIVVFGASDGIVEITGTINEELNNGVILLIPKGKKVQLYDEDEGERWEEGGEEAIAIQLKDDAEVFGNRIESHYFEGRWRFETKLPNHTFQVFEDGELFCIGIVIDEKDLI